MCLSWGVNSDRGLRVTGVWYEEEQCFGFGITGIGFGEMACLVPQEPIELVEKEEAVDDVVDNESDGSVNEDSTRWGKYVHRIMEMPRSQPIGYYLNHEINEKTIEGLVDNQKYNDYLLATCIGFVYPVDFIILDIKEDEYMPLILGIPFLPTARAEIKFDKGAMTLKAGIYKIRFVRTLEFPSKIEVILDEVSLVVHWIFTLDDSWMMI
ncbi:hypothetical protein Tco_0946362 [Tanacetum coccineum]